MTRRTSGFAVLAVAVTALTAAFIAAYLPLDTILLLVFALLITYYSMVIAEGPRSVRKTEPVARGRVVNYANAVWISEEEKIQWKASNPFEERVLAEANLGSITDSRLAQLKGALRSELNEVPQAPGVGRSV